MLLLVAAECAGHTYLFTRSSSLSFFLSFFIVLLLVVFTIAFITDSKHYWQLQFFSCWHWIIVCFSTGECFTGLRTSTAVWRRSLLSCLYSPPSSFSPFSGQGAHQKGLSMVDWIYQCKECVRIAKINWILSSPLTDSLFIQPHVFNPHLLLTSVWNWVSQTKCLACWPPSPSLLTSLSLLLLRFAFT